jgi:hypothetical protein
MRDHPLHLAVALRELGVVLLVDVHAVAPAVLGRIAGLVGGAQQARQVVPAGGVDRHQPDADADLERLVQPHEAEVAHRLAQLVGDALRPVEPAAFQQHAELVAAEARQDVRLAQLSAQDRGELAQQLVAGDVAAGVVHDLELVEVDVEQRVMLVERLGALEQLLEKVLELAAVDQAGERVVAGVPGELLGEEARAGHVPEHQHRADHAALAVADRRRRVLDDELLAVLADQQRVSAAGQRGIGLLRRAAARRDRLARLLVDDVEDPVQRLALRGCRLPAGHLLGDRIEVADPATGVGGDHGVADRVQGHLGQFLFVEQRALGLRGAARDVHGDEHADQEGRGAEQRHESVGVAVDAGGAGDLRAVELHLQVDEFVELVEDPVLRRDRLAQQDAVGLVDMAGHDQLADAVLQRHRDRQRLALLHQDGALLVRDLHLEQSLAGDGEFGRHLVEADEALVLVERVGGDGHRVQQQRALARGAVHGEDQIGVRAVALEGFQQVAIDGAHLAHGDDRDGDEQRQHDREAEGYDVFRILHGHRAGGGRWDDAAPDVHDFIVETPPWRYGGRRAGARGPLLSLA